MDERLDHPAVEVGSLLEEVREEVQDRQHGDRQREATDENSDRHGDTQHECSIDDPGELRLGSETLAATGRDHHHTRRAYPYRSVGEIVVASCFST
ncbi:hypothetical protein D3C74_425700 [compost metagenome]